MSRWPTVCLYARIRNFISTNRGALHAGAAHCEFEGGEGEELLNLLLGKNKESAGSRMVNQC